MQVTLKKWGNSVGIRIPSSVMLKLNLITGSELSLTERDGEIILTPQTRKKYLLDDLIKQCDLAVPQNSELDTWQNPQKVGNEIW